ncbi:hypothetical protein TNCV_132581 [Trichonephila clavipes]|nr:hypothetical protein TNCV_132581 [Trichonephila clavipes]
MSSRRLPGMFRLPKSSYNRRVIVTFMNLRICAGLNSTLFLIVAPPRRSVPARWCGWFVAALLHLRLRVRPLPKSVDFHDAENR